jgi:uncharacterized protein YecE (DUF72 family)
VPEPDDTALRQSLDALAPLRESGRLGPLLAQFPASFKATPEAIAYLEWLTRQLGGLPLAVELRHRSWSDARRETLELLDAARAAWVLIDEPKFRSSVWQSPSVFVEELRDRPWAYVRLHGRNAAQWWDHESSEDRYNYLYSPEELEPFVDVAAAAAALGKKLYLYANNHFAGNAVANAAQVRARLGDPVQAPFPRSFIERFPQLAGVVTTDGLGRRRRTGAGDDLRSRRARPDGPPSPRGRRLRTHAGVDDEPPRAATTSRRGHRRT